jgi:hypothetical protein
MSRFFGWQEWCDRYTQYSPLWGGGGGTPMRLRCVPGYNYFETICKKDMRHVRLVKESEEYFRKGIFLFFSEFFIET